MLCFDELFKLTTHETSLLGRNVAALNERKAQSAKAQVIGGQHQLHKAVLDEEEDGKSFHHQLVRLAHGIKIWKEKGKNNNNNVNVECPRISVSSGADIRTLRMALFPCLFVHRNILFVQDKEHLQVCLNAVQQIPLPPPIFECTANVLRKTLL